MEISDSAIREAKETAMQCVGAVTELARVLTNINAQYFSAQTAPEKVVAMQKAVKCVIDFLQSIDVQENDLYQTFLGLYVELGNTVRGCHSMFEEAEPKRRKGQQKACSIADEAVWADAVALMELKMKLTPCSKDVAARAVEGMFTKHGKRFPGRSSSHNSAGKIAPPGGRLRHYRDELMRTSMVRRMADQVKAHVLKGQLPIEIVAQRLAQEVQRALPMPQQPPPIES